MILPYKRIMLKLSGEALQGDKKVINYEYMLSLAKEVKEFVKAGMRMAIVIGGGNIWRYRDFKEIKLPRTTSDYLGMLATVFNSVALANGFNSNNIPAKVLCSFHITQVAQFYTPALGLKNLGDGNVVIVAGGTGNPFFTTDSAAALRALELECEILLKATNVDYVYDRDPDTSKDAHKYLKISYNQVLERNLKVMDATAISLCRDGKLPVIVFNIEKKDNLRKLLHGERIGTLISED